jgi:hypothetical protein
LRYGKASRLAESLSRRAWVGEAAPRHAASLLPPGRGYHGIRAIYKASSVVMEQRDRGRGSLPGPPGAFEPTTARRPRWLLALSLLSMLLAAGTAVAVEVVTSGAGLFCGVARRLSGSEIPLAANVVLWACALGVLASIFVRQHPVVLSLVLSLTAGALLAGIVLVAWDSAATTYIQTCGFMGPTTTKTVADHVWYVYVVWGVALAVLLLQLRRALRFDEFITDPVDARSRHDRSRPRSRYARSRHDRSRPRSRYEARGRYGPTPPGESQ